MTRAGSSPRLASCIVLALAACDPVHSDAIDALGGETAGVRPGPEHRPGQPCLLCHDGALGDPGEFSVAGTVFLQRTGTLPAQGVNVELKSANGSRFTTSTNRAGNFYITPSRFTPEFPMQVSVTFEGQRVDMLTSVGRDGACGGCHRPEPGPDSPGHVYVRLDDGGVPTTDGGLAP
jgi:hypothetical protein